MLVGVKLVRRLVLFDQQRSVYKNLPLRFLPHLIRKKSKVGRNCVGEFISCRYTCSKKDEEDTANDSRKQQSKDVNKSEQIPEGNLLQTITPAAADNVRSPNVEKKVFELKTTNAMLSITTTIEDSKINEVVFEKHPKKKLPHTPTSSSRHSQTETISPAEEEKPASEIKANGVTDRIKAKLKLKQAILTAATAEQVKDIAGTQVVKEEAMPKKKERSKVDINRASLERNFITPLRAMTDFLLKPADLESLTKIKRRSPYEQEPPITVFWRKDVEAKAIKVWGSREKLLKECLKREIERKKHQQNLFTVKRRLRDYRREIGSRAVIYGEEIGLKGKSGKVVLIAIGINATNFIFKACCWVFTGSHSMFAETVHSLADTLNQCILAYGIHKSTQSADPAHPYGYTNMRYVSALISGVGIFCVGCGLSYYHGITGLISGGPPEDFFWAFFILGGSLVSEGATLLVAINEVRRAAKEKHISFREYVVSGRDPCVNVVLMEDAAAVASVSLAAGCMGLTSLTGSSVFDAAGSLLVGTVLGGVASFIIYTNVQALVGRSIPEEQLDKINSELESDVMIRAIYDVKGIDMGNSLVRYKAEMDFDGRELTRSYLDKQDLNELLKTVRKLSTVEELEEFLLNHGENIVDLMGGEIDRIEMKLRKKFPELRHCDLEIL